MSGFGAYFHYFHALQLELVGNHLENTNTRSKNELGELQLQELVNVIIRMIPIQFCGQRSVFYKFRGCVLLFSRSPVGISWN